MFQTLLPFFVAGLGQICTGLFFERAQHWWFFVSVPESFVLIPALLGLKGNLEVTYASRFCTMSNAGRTHNAEEIFTVARFNLSLVEFQACVLSFLAAVLSTAISLISCDFNSSHFLVVFASGIYAAALSSLVVGTMMVVLVVITRRYDIDPDNIAAPITATFSDFITLLALIGCGMLFLYLCIHQACLFSVLLVLFLLCATPCMAWYAFKNPHTRDILKHGWPALVAATIAEWQQIDFQKIFFSFSGLLLQSSISVFPGIAALHPLITGLGGNRVSVQSSRLCTALHLSPYPLGTLPDGTTVRTYFNPFRLLCLQHIDSKVAFLLLLTAIPYNFLFVIIVIFAAKNVDFSWILVSAYVVAAFVQGLVLFYLCQVTVYTLWWLRMDPDNSSFPILTSVGDVLGIGMLYAVFLILSLCAPKTVRYQHYQTMNSTRHCGVLF
ncbi:unnamed protein product [Gongylonema pulchrum]|uniref:SLC41A/MgtE integral membrane domain-containing protein n=1 Tax=Gongylonema pulchrum TaxID=637853 RepID=A0A3P6PCX8_9BILA|nr:unnamed protein product [Gongylonema pulchrum]